VRFVHGQSFCYPITTIMYGLTGLLDIPNGMFITGMHLNIGQSKIYSIT